MSGAKRANILLLMWALCAAVGLSIERFPPPQFETVIREAPNNPNRIEAHNRIGVTR